MQPRITKVGGFFKSSVFSTLVFLNFIISICFVVMIIVQSMDKTTIPQTEAIEQNPVQLRVLEETAQLIKLP